LPEAIGVPQYDGIAVADTMATRLTGRTSMAEERATLVTNCVDLWEAGELQLKPLAAHYRNVVSKIFAAEAATGVFWRSQELAGPNGPARGAWQYLADTTLTILQETAENLEAAGEVLVMASHEYAETERINTRDIENEQVIRRDIDRGSPQSPGIQAPGGGS
jgi:hypothetical protein